MGGSAAARRESRECRTDAARVPTTDRAAAGRKPAHTPDAGGQLQPIVRRRARLGRVGWYGCVLVWENPTWVEHRNQDL